MKQEKQPEYSKSIPIKVLHVEDTVGDLELTRLFLKRKGYINLAITPVLSAEQALKALEREEFDVIISDYKMPGMNGLEFLDALKKRGHDTPFILFTGKGEEKVAMAALNKGASGYINKDGSPAGPIEALAKLIHEVVERKKEKGLVNDLAQLLSQRGGKERVTNVHLREHLDTIILGLLAERTIAEEEYKIVSEPELGREIRHNFGISVKPEALHTTLDDLRARGLIRDIPGAGVMWNAKPRKKTRIYPSVRWRKER